MSIENARVPYDRLALRCNPDELGFKTTAELQPLEGTIGQERAISALELGLDIEEPGFNIFISGPSGSGRNTALRAYVDGIAANRPVPPDWGYVHNFEDASQSVAISLPCGMMRTLKHDMEELVDTCKREIPRAFESDEYTHRIEEAMKDVQAQTQAMTDEMEKKALAAGFVLRPTPSGIAPAVMKDGRPVTQEEYGALPEAERDQLRERAEEIQDSIAHTTAELRRLTKAGVEQGREVDKDVVRFTLGPIIEDLRVKYVDFPQMVDYLDQVESDMAEHQEIFKPAVEALQAVMPGFAGVQAGEDVLGKYRVNDLVDNTSCEGGRLSSSIAPPTTTCSVESNTRPESVPSAQTLQ